MKCAMTGCAGLYEVKTIVHTARQQGKVLVIDHVPAKVCNLCGNVLLAPETVRRIEALLRVTPPPRRKVVYYELA